MNNCQKNLTPIKQLILSCVAQALKVTRHILGSDSQENVLKTISGCFLGVATRDLPDDSFYILIGHL